MKANERGGLKDVICFSCQTQRLRVARKGSLQCQPSLLIPFNSESFETPTHANVPAVATLLLVPDATSRHPNQSSLSNTINTDVELQQNRFAVQKMVKFTTTYRTSKSIANFVSRTAKSSINSCSASLETLTFPSLLRHQEDKELPKHLMVATTIWMSGLRWNL